MKGPYGGYVLRQNVYVPQRFITPDIIDVSDKKIYNCINRAIKNKSKCFVEYYSKDRKRLSKRVICPYELILFGNEWGVAAYCELKNEIRHFYLNRIQSIELLEKI